VVPPVVTMAVSGGRFRRNIWLGQSRTVGNFTATSAAEQMMRAESQF
jgi:hypothetical protein